MNGLLQEKNIREIYNKSTTIPIAKFNIVFPIFMGFTLLLFLVFSDTSIKSSYDKINDLTSFLFSSLFATLGFLVAGYTIFCTITPLDLQKKMIAYTDKKTQLIFFKKVHFTFIRVFIYFLIFSFTLFIIFVFKGLNINLSNSSISPEILSNLYKYTNYSIITFLTMGTTFLFCELSSFIFNIYNSIATTLHWVIQNQTDSKKEE
ncbi:hypothetical protein [Acinetobacter terrae]|uniref:hypothetical protein n=1 Tax=Acinetobacter terrae TaxID=2731247 RepID=UPI0007D7A478|nr:hypothetical protein [Acinetobacter terrae]OAL76350.1 hypothetical protein AY608_08520 [Acinetobacter terrae]